MQIRFYSSIDAIGKKQWNDLCGDDYPFIQYEFLAALEHSGCTSVKNGWQPHHLSIEDSGKIVGLMPLYIKTHSYGEYVFDWGWADAYHRHGLQYYPKLLSAIPFTPATGPRLCLNNSVELENVLPLLRDAIQEECRCLEASSWHCLFPTKEVSDALTRHSFNQREGHQYHWLNQGYRNFDDFLDSFNSRKRKNLRKERQKVREQDLQLVAKRGEEITDEDWLLFYQYYHLTYFKRSGRQGYLNQDFFSRIASEMADKIVMVQAHHESSNQMVAAALFFTSEKTLYGRYWGCSHEFEFLHFEACYYQGIEYAIEHGFERFDPGAQGEHKIQRGFTPIATYSNHWIEREDFREAIERFLVEEKKYNQEYLLEAQELLPFKVVDDKTLAIAKTVENRPAKPPSK